MNSTEKKGLLKMVVKFIHKEIDEEALDYFAEGMAEKTIEKNSTFISTTKIHNEIGFIAKGLLRGFYIDDKGREINTRFIGEMNFATHYKAFICREPSKYCFQAVEKCELLCFDYNFIQTCFRMYPGLEKFGRLMAEAIIKKMDARLESQQFDDAEKRYKDFLQEYPDLHNRLTLEHIASYIRVTRPALSRIRGKKS